MLSLIWQRCASHPYSRIIMLETVAGVPGMVGGMTRHFHSLRRLTRDHGWIHTLLGTIIRYETRYLKIIQ